MITTEEKKRIAELCDRVIELRWLGLEAKTPKDLKLFSSAARSLADYAKRLEKVYQHAQEAEEHPPISPPK